MNLRSLFTTLSLLALAMLPGCGSSSNETAASDSRRVATSFYPLTYFVEEIAGDAVEIYAPVPADADPAFWKPPTEALVGLQDSRLILLNGAGFEKWVGKVSLPESRIVRTAKGFSERWIEREEESHSHGGLAPHSHGAIDGHTWMDPLQALEQAEAVQGALAKSFPDEDFQAGMEALKARLVVLDLRWQALAPKLRKASVIASHRSYDYPARRYGFRVENFDLAPQMPLDAHDLDHVLDHAGKGAPRLMLWESEPLAETVEALRARGITSVVFAPAESLDESQRTAGSDFYTIMLDNLERLGAALGE